MCGWLRVRDRNTGREFLARSKLALSHCTANVVSIQHCPTPDFDICNPRSHLRPLIVYHTRMRLVLRGWTWDTTTNARWWHWCVDGLVIGNGLQLVNTFARSKLAVSTCNTNVAWAY